ncbi:MAG: hypothetical protein K6C97_11335 [Treponema sp.]|nr:hypothetical protein [Treponema sp.]
MKKVLLSLLSILTVLFFISCGSKPAAEETEPEAPTVEDVVDTAEAVEIDNTDITSFLTRIKDARDESIAAGAEEKAPDQLKQIDDLYASLKDSVKSADADTIVARYKLLTDYIKAKDAKEEIDENAFASYAQSNYDKGSESLAIVEDAFNSSADLNSEIFEAGKDAYSNFNTVLSVAYKKLAKEERSNAYEAKKLADSVKAGVAQKERYNTAAEDFKSGDSLYSMQNPKKALEKYTSAKEEFDALYKEVSEKRAAAQAAIEEAKRRVAEAAEYAEVADEKAPITEPVEGIEEEDAVLLEADDYENPEDAEADIAETIEDEADAEAVEEE